MTMHSLNRLRSVMLGLLLSGCLALSLLRCSHTGAKVLEQYNYTVCFIEADGKLHCSHSGSKDFIMTPGESGGYMCLPPKDAGKLLERADYAAG